MKRPSNAGIFREWSPGGRGQTGGSPAGGATNGAPLRGCGAIPATARRNSPGTFLIHLRDAGEECPRPTLGEGPPPLPPPQNLPEKPSRGGARLFRDLLGSPG